MFKMNSDVLQSVVASMKKSVKDSCIGDQNVYIKNLGESSVSFYFTSIDLSAEKRIPAEDVGQFLVATSLTELATKVEALPSNESIELMYVKKGQGQFVEMVWGGKKRRSEMTLRLLNEETEFLEVPAPTQKVLWGPNFLNQIASKFKTFAAKPTSEDARQSPALSGISFSKSSSGKCVLRVSDKHNAVKYLSEENDWINEEIVIDTAHLQGISSLIPNDTSVEVGINERASLAIFQTEDTTCVCRVIEGKFPMIDQLYNYNVECKYVFDRSELMELCSRVLKITANGAKMVKFEVRNNAVFAVVPHELEQQLGATVEGLEWSFAINAKKLFECVKLFEAEDEVTLYITDPCKLPITIGSDELPEIMMCTLPYNITRLNAEKSMAAKV